MMSRSFLVRPALHVVLVALGAGYLLGSSPCAAQEDGEAELGRHILLLSANVKGGSMKRNYFKINILGEREPLEDHPLDGPLLELGGMATYGFMPARRSGFTMGGRIRAGGYVSEEFRSYLGSSLVLGSTVGARVDRRYAYFLGGLGAEHLPSEKLSALALSFQGGRSFGGLLVGGGLDLAIGQYVGFQVGLEVGYGALW